MRISEARKLLSAIGYKIDFNKDTSEFRICPNDGKEAQAYYTSDIIDAVQTGIAQNRLKVKTKLKTIAY